MKPQLIYYLSCLAFAMLLPTIRVQAQEGTNYILKETNLSSNASQKIQSYQFFDDLGRKTLDATNGITNNGDFTYSLQEILGEQLVTKKWLPVIGVSSIGPLNVLGVSALSSIQYEDDDAYNSFEYDALGRVKKEYKAGTEWKSQPVTVSYLTAGFLQVSMTCCSENRTAYAATCQQMLICCIHDRICMQLRNRYLLYSDHSNHLFTASPPSRSQHGRLLR